MNTNLILASASPRRKELLELLQIPFKVIPSEVEEKVDETLHPEEMVKLLAQQKAEYVAKSNQNAYVIGSDTLVVYDGQMLGKPVDKNHAIEILQKLSGKTHEVYTGVSIIYGSQIRSFTEKTAVTFYPLSNKEIEDYVSTGEPMDKAGGYGIQGYGSLLVNKISGDYYAVVGLPIARLKRELEIVGFFSN
ncbi:Maf family protein [Virgibacillus sp. 6R]|uniref:Maf family protein n=1 Tax=Metabacillus sp. 22489 TaxID=3453928 RepID=UPI0011A31881